MKITPRYFWSLLVVMLLACSYAQAEEKEKTGTWVDRAEGKLNLLVKNGNFELHFFDKDEEPMAPDAVSATIHYTSQIVRKRETFQLLPAQGKEEIILTSPRALQPPYQYQVLLVLFMDPEGNKTETFNFFFQQAAAK